MKHIEEQPNTSTVVPDVLALACEPIPCVRIAFIGLGKRGKESIHHFLHMQGVVIQAVCDLNEENLHYARCPVSYTHLTLPTKA